MMKTRVVIDGANEPSAAVDPRGYAAYVTVGDDLQATVTDPDPDVWLDRLAAKCLTAAREYRGETEPASEPAEPVVPEGMALIEPRELDQLRRDAGAMVAIREGRRTAVTLDSGKDAYVVHRSQMDRYRAALVAIIQMRKALQAGGDS